MYEAKVGITQEYQMFIKRALDICQAIAFMVLLSPLFLIIPILIKLEDGGPVFFYHERVGKDGELFKVWKFRTMVQNAEKLGPGLTAANDSRITQIGKILRRLSLDELPQLFNVLFGEMSIVGPRPEIPEIVKSYTDRQKRVLAVKPGMTGLTQVNGRDDLPIDTKLEYDITYVENYSLTLDFKILFRTIPVVINGRGCTY